jgi:hypothetical protein
MFCDRCGQNFLPKQSVCSRCQTPSTRHWLHLMSLSTLFVAALLNSLVAIAVLPRLVTRPHASFFFHAWLWFDLKAAVYGWMFIAVGLLAWDYFVWREARPKVKGWFTRKILTLAIGSGIAPLLPWWVPAGQPPAQFLDLVYKYPALPISLAWASIVVVAVMVCIDAESRGYLLGSGRTMSLVSIGVLLLVLTMTVVGWSLSFSS